MEPKLSNQDIPRYSQRSLPSYRHLPFQNPHPFLDVDGHSYGENLAPVEGFGQTSWTEAEDYLYAVDLFNNGFWWEAHERLKQVSIGAGRESTAGRFIQGLIQVSAGLLKHFMAQDAPARALIELGLSNLEVEQNPYLGIDVAALKGALNACLDHDDSVYPSICLRGIGVH
ncbi:MAG: DUF309 domain-containing protein [Desulfuromonadales bacterium]|nr:DUF309 domain-containing protein [Desulfuromonadales bacterium]MBN2792644.1 DUF309 domain-containing protein [Desulfuromonadales bacterium]